MIVGVLIDVIVFLVAHLAMAKLLRAPGLELLLPRPVPNGASLARRLGVRAAGPLAVYLVSAGIFTIAFSMTGEPGTTVTVAPDRAAARAGIRDGDRVVAVDGEGVGTFDELREAVQARGKAGTPLAITVERDGARRRIAVTAGSDGLIGVLSSGEVVTAPLGPSVARGLAQPFTVLGAWASTIGRAASGEVEPVEVAGPVEIVRRISRDAPSARQRSVVAVAVLGHVCAAIWPFLVLFAVVMAALGERRRSAVVRDPG